MIEERLSMYDDLMEKDPKMIRIRAESEARGEARGEAKGETKGRTQELRMTIVAFVQVRFPTLVELANQKVKHLSTPDELRLLFQQLLHAADEDVARSLLTTSAG